jgi:hypothetical protein
MIEMEERLRKCAKRGFIRGAGISGDYYLDPTKIREKVIFDFLDAHCIVCDATDIAVFLSFLSINIVGNYLSPFMGTSHLTLSSET